MKTLKVSMQIFSMFALSYCLSRWHRFDLRLRHLSRLTILIPTARLGGHLHWVAFRGFGRGTCSVPSAASAFPCADLLRKLRIITCDWSDWCWVV